MVTQKIAKSLSDEELVGLVLKQKDNYLYLMERYERKLFSYIKRITGLSPEDIEDILQEIFIKAYRHLNSFNRKLKFSSWIYRIAHNEAISYHRKISSRPKLLSGKDSEALFRVLASECNLERESRLQSDKDGIKLILGRLDKKYRDVLVLKFFEEKDYREISDILQKPMGTIATLINRAKKEFKKIASQDNLNFESK